MRIERDLLKVLDQNNVERAGSGLIALFVCAVFPSLAFISFDTFILLAVRPIDVVLQKGGREGKALDSEQNEIMKGSVVKVRACVCVRMFTR